VTGFGAVLKDALDELACGCPVCSQHELAHVQVPRTVLGSTVHIDVELAPLIDGLERLGVRTVASCVDLADATARLWPEKLPDLLAQQGIPGVNYGRVVAERLAFVRMINGPKAAGFLRAVDARGGVVTRAGILAQAAFPRTLLAEMAVQ
jgi:hypothetical protein